jgi:hypothetical protein
VIEPFARTRPIELLTPRGGPRQKAVVGAGTGIRTEELHGDQASEGLIAQQASH